MRARARELMERLVERGEICAPPRRAQAVRIHCFHMEFQHPLVFSCDSSSHGGGACAGRERALSVVCVLHVRQSAARVHESAACVRARAALRQRGKRRCAARLHAFCRNTWSPATWHVPFGVFVSVLGSSIASCMPPFVPFAACVEFRRFSKASAPSEFASTGIFWLSACCCAAAACQ